MYLTIQLRWLPEPLTIKIYIDVHYNPDSINVFILKVSFALDRRNASSCCKKKRIIITLKCSFCNIVLSVHDLAFRPVDGKVIILTLTH